MEPQRITPMNPISPETRLRQAAGKRPAGPFQSLLAQEDVSLSGLKGPGAAKEINPSLPHGPAEPALRAIPGTRSAAAAYQKQEAPLRPPEKLSDLQKYKDDQLLSNPGGDDYYLDENRVDPDAEEHHSFWGRIGKDLSDAFANLKNCFHDFLFGAKIRYRDQNNQIRETTRKGLVGSMVDFFKDLGSAFSLGTWRPDGEAEPRGFGKRVGFFFTKLKEAFFGDLIQGVSGSVLHMGEDLLFAGWNMLETLPDATIGNFKAGRELTTSFFDNGQVALDYITDIIPSGDAWLRVHSPNPGEPFRPPLLHNLTVPEETSGDVRWRHVRNTPFRKAIETIGSLLMDLLTFKVLGQIRLFGEETRQRQ